MGTSSRYVWLLFTGAAVLLALNAWTGSQFPSDDCIYAVTARESLASGGILDMTWQGVPFYEKGPVLPWLLMASISVLGETELALRLPGIVFGVVLLWGVYALARATGLGRWAAAFAVAGALAFNVFYLNARRPMTDVPGTALALAGLVLAGFPPGLGGRARIAAGGFLLGLSSLTKLVAPFPFVVTLAALKARDTEGRRATMLALAVAFLTALPWHVYMIAAHGREFVDVYFVFHLLRRASGAVVGTEGDPVYLAWLVEREGGGAFLAGLALSIALVRAARGCAASRTAVLLVAAAFAPLVLASTALPHYLVPVVPGAALALGAAFDHVYGRVKARAGTWASGAVGAALAVVTAVNFAAANAADLESPRYSPGTKAACKFVRSVRGNLLATFDLHDTSAAWYCGGFVRFLAHDPGFVAATRDIPLLDGVVGPADPDALQDIARRGGLVLTRVDRMADLRGLAGRAGLSPRTRRFRDRVLVRLDSTGRTSAEQQRPVRPVP